MSVGYGRLEDGYEIKSPLGRGTFGTVNAAVSRDESHRLVAVKSLKEVHSCRPEQLREVIFYECVPEHPNIVTLFEAFVDENTKLINFVFELMDFTMLDLIKRRAGTPFRVETVASIAKQLARGMAHIHAYGFVHRDIKPENILIGISLSDSAPKGVVQRRPEPFRVKIGDFGLAKMEDGRTMRKWTSYVATRWYRTPEQLLRHLHHNRGLDIWAFGTVLLEVCNLQPVFPGHTASDMITRIVQRIGTPSTTTIGGPWPLCESVLQKNDPCTVEEWQPFINNTRFFLSTFEPGVQIEDLIKTPQLAAFAPVCAACLRWDSTKRPSCGTILAMLNKAILQKPIVRTTPLPV